MTPIRRTVTTLCGLTFFAVMMFAVDAVSAPPNGMEQLRETGKAFRSVAKQVSPAVVFIKVEKEVAARNGRQLDPFSDEFFRRFFGVPPQRQTPQQRPQQRRQAGQGSGFFISSDGYILTNNHVVAEADYLRVQLQDGREYPAEIVGTDPGSDLAVLKVDDRNLPYLTLGDSQKLEVGDWVLAFGNPFGLSHSLTAGVVSAKGRSGIGLTDYEDFIQTDAAINPGNSGGPLVNLNGEVVGINTAIFSRSGGYMGIGFAIPVNMAKVIRDQLIESGEVRRGRLGVAMQDLDQDLAESFGLSKAEGILINQVVEGSPAERAGLKQGDIVLRMDGRPVGKTANFRNRIALTSPGSTVTLELIRNGKPKTIRAEIGEPQEEQMARSGRVESLGVTLADLTPELTRKYQIAQEFGVVIIEVEAGSIAQQTGLTPGTMILELNRKRIQNVREALKILESPGRRLLILVQQGPYTRYITLRAG